MKSSTPKAKPRGVKTLCGLLTLTTLVSLGGYFGWRKLEMGGSGFPLLVISSAGFVVMAALAAAAYRSRFGAAMLIALLFCGLGDLIGQYHFQSSVLAFALAHVGFVVAFWLHGIAPGRVLGALPVALLASGGVCFWLFPHVPRFDMPLVAGYVIIITSMVVFAGGTRDGPARRLLLASAVLFFISDIFVARWKFVVPDSVNAYFCYPLYYLSCLGFGWSIVARGTGDGPTSNPGRAEDASSRFTTP